MKSKANKSLKKNYLILFAVVATELIGFGLFIPILPQMALQFKVSGFWMGVFVSTYSLCQFLAAPLLGSLSDRYGRKPLLVFSKLGTFFSYILLAHVNSFPLFIAARALDGLSGGNIAVARAYIVDITPGENKAKGMAIIGISFATGFIVGPALGGFLFSYFDTHYIPALIAGSFSLLAAVLTALFLEESNTKKADTWHLIAPLPKALIQSKILPILSIQLVFMCLFAGFEVTLSVFTNQYFNFTIADNSKLFFLSGILTLIIQGYYSSRPFQNLSLAVSVGLFSTAAGFMILSLASSLIVLIAGLAIFAFGIGTILTHLPSLLSQNTPAEQSGQIMGFYDSVGSISRFIGPQIIYSLFFIQLKLAYLSASIALATVAVLFVVFWPKQLKKKS